MHKADPCGGITVIDWTLHVNTGEVVRPQVVTVVAAAAEVVSRAFTACVWVGWFGQGGWKERQKCQKKGVERGCMRVILVVSQAIGDCPVRANRGGV
jgi:hypothetical protein